MHRGVGLIEARHIAIGDQGGLHGEVAAELGELVFGDRLGHTFDGGHLDRLAQEGAFADFLHREAGDEGARLRHHIDKAFGGKTGDGIGDGAARDAERIANLWFPEDFAGAVGEGKDRLAQGLIDALAEGARETVERREPCLGAHLGRYL